MYVTRLSDLASINVFTDFRHQDDESVASRGSLAMKSAILKTSPGGNALRFEIHSTPSRGHQGVQKWYMRTNHPVETSRWVQAITKSIEWHKNKDERPSGESILRAPSMRGSIASSNLALGSGTSTTTRKQTGSSIRSTTSSLVGNSDSPPNPGDSLSRTDLIHGGGFDDSSEELMDAGDKPPFDDLFEIQGNYVHVQIGLISEYLQEVLKPDTQSPKFGESTKHLKDSVSNVQEIVGEYLEMVRRREAWWKGQVKHERARQDVWEKSLQAVVREGEELEQELRNRTRKKSKMFSGIPAEGSATLKTRPSHLPISGSLFESEAFTVSPETTPGPSTTTNSSAFATALGNSTSSMTTPTGTATDRQYSLNASALSPDTGIDTDEEDEFFDAIEANNLPNLVISQALENHQDRLLEFNKRQYSGYANLRKQLAITTDNRPPTSLWSVLKNSIGKDLTRISFPVFFNEPTSMLQRMVSTISFFLFICADSVVIGGGHGVPSMP